MKTKTKFGTTLFLTIAAMALTLAKDVMPRPETGLDTAILQITEGL